MMISSTRRSLSQPPAPNETEVSLFGPGVGECIVVHLGHGDWVIVDSCTEAGESEGVALRYLRQLEVDIATSVKAVVVTHWHDDHIRGAAGVLRAAKSAELVCSSALHTRHFQQGLGVSASRAQANYGVDEMRGMLDILRERKRGRKASVGPVWAAADKCILQGDHYAIHSLSPSDGTLTLAFQELEQLQPRRDAPKRRAVSVKPNQSAVVLWVCSGSNTLLLGADLEVGKDPRTGWLAILSSSTRPRGIADFYKVAHHGSANADHPSIWRELLVEQSTAALAPFSKGTEPLPRKCDLDRIGRSAGAAYCSSSAKPRRAKYERSVEKLLRGVTKNGVRQVRQSMGHVRLRRTLDGTGQWNVDLNGPAFRIG